MLIHFKCILNISKPSCNETSLITSLLTVVGVTFYWECNNHTTTKILQNQPEWHIPTSTTRYLYRGHDFAITKSESLSILRSWTKNFLLLHFKQRLSAKYRTHLKLLSINALSILATSYDHHNVNEMMKNKHEILYEKYKNKIHCVSVFSFRFTWQLFWQVVPDFWLAGGLTADC